MYVYIYIYRHLLNDIDKKTQRCPGYLLSLVGRAVVNSRFLDYSYS